MKYCTQDTEPFITTLKRQKEQSFSKKKIQFDF